MLRCKECNVSVNDIGAGCNACLLFKRTALVKDGRGDMSLVGDIERLSHTARGMLRHLSKVYKRQTVDDGVYDKDLVTSIAKVAKIYEGLIKMVRAIKSDTQQTLMKMSSYDRLRLMAKFLATSPEEDRRKVLELSAIPYIRDATVIKPLSQRTPMPPDVNRILREGEELNDVELEEVELSADGEILSASDVDELVADAEEQKDEAWERRMAEHERKLEITKVERPAPAKFEAENTSELPKYDDWLEVEPEPVTNE